MRTAGVVLCGGLSSRMGTPKAWLPVGDELMLPRVVRVVGEAAGTVVVVAAPGQAVPRLPAGVRVVRDEAEGQGPLGGLCAGMAALEGEADAVYLSSCDVPLLTTAFVWAVLAAVEEPTPRPPPCREGVNSGSAACETANFGFAESEEASRAFTPSLQGGGRGVGLCAVPFVAGRLHPLAAAYALSALPVAREHRAAGRLRMTDLLDRLAAVRLAAHELPDLESLRNVNTPDEYAAALHALRTS